MNTTRSEDESPIEDEDERKEEDEEPAEEYCIFREDDLCPLSVEYDLDTRIAKLCLPCQSGRTPETGAITWIAVILTIDLLIAIATAVVLFA